MDFRTNSFRALGPRGFHRVRYLEWGDPANPRVLFCVHGLTRNARDFDALAERLAGHYRVICPDVVGRGGSDWLEDKAGYGYPQYCADMAALIARSGADVLDWVGTSMGGLIGMTLAAQPNTPIRRLVLNDVGPFIPKAALERIAAYVGVQLVFDDLEQFERYARVIFAPFGALSDAQWRVLAEHSARTLPDGRLAFAYDPGIAEPFRTMALDDLDLWSVWDRIACPTLVLRGADSDLLTPAIAAEMTARGPRAALVEIPGCGHAPALMDAPQIATIRDWLLAGAA